MNVHELRIRKLLDDESDTRRLGINAKYCVISAMCEHHQALNGELFEFSEMESIYNLNKVPESCRCAVFLTLIDELGKPIQPKVIERIKSKTK